jgi:vitamin K-dependent gamma-carboxylase
MIQSLLFRKVSPLSLVFFRIFFALVILWDVHKYLTYNLISRYWVNPDFNFRYEGFFWVTPLSESWMTGFFYVLGVLCLFVLFGFLYRISSLLLLILFTYSFLLEQARYLNHFYLVILLGILMPFLPAHRAYSIDAKLWPHIKRNWVPYWSILILQFQIGVVYFFGGIAKLNMDWLQGRPLQFWLPPRKHMFPFISQYFELKEFALFVSYSGLLLDLLAFPLLMYRRTRPFIVFALIMFHFTNDRLFHIGIFPWFMIGALLVYYPTSWPVDFFRFLKQSRTLSRCILFISLLLGAALSTWFHGSFHIIPLICGSLLFPILYWDFMKNPAEDPDRKHKISAHSKMITAWLILWCSMQILIPLRHFVIPGNPSWTEEGHRFAWHMKLRSKSCKGHFFTFNEHDKSKITLRSTKVKTWQYRKMLPRPNMVIQYAQLLSTENDNVPVYADIICSLNGHRMKRLIDEKVDLTKVQFYDWKRNEWILLDK